LFKRLIVLLLVTGGLLGGPALSAWAQTPTPNQINEVAKNLWCPLCNGVRLDNCELQACVQMREVIAQKLAAGENQEQIRAYFVQQYGDVVLGAPSTQGFNRLAWILPVLAAAVGLGWLVYFVRSTTRKRPVPAATGAQPAPPSDDVLDDYIQRVDDELDRTR
jgi:cytochrome c-type biogenesis protein CcmH